MNATEVRINILSWAKQAPEALALPSQSERGLIIGVINKAVRLGGKTEDANYRRKQVLAWLFRDILGRPMASAVSTKDLTPVMWWCLMRYADLHKDTDTGVWVGVNGFDEDMRACYHAMESWERDMDRQLGFDVL